jgi:YD repeat-containing protein
VEVLYQSGRIHQVKDTSGQVALSFEYTGNHVSKVTDRAGRSVLYSHSVDDLVSATDVLGKAEMYEYDAGHNLTERTTRTGAVRAIAYDGQDRWASSADPLGNVASAHYNPLASKTVFVDRMGASWTTEFNAAGNPTAHVDPLGNRVEKTWSAVMTLTGVKDARGLATALRLRAESTRPANFRKNCTCTSPTRHSEIG